MKKRWGCLLLVGGLLVGSACAAAEQEASRSVPSETSVQNGMQRSDWQASSEAADASGGAPTEPPSELWPESVVPSDTEADVSSDRQPEVESEEWVSSGPADDSSAEEPSETEVSDEALAAARRAAMAHYAGTVFTIHVLTPTRATDRAVTFRVACSKGEERQVDRSITLERREGTWVVVSEGY